MTKQHNEEVRELLKLMGIPWVTVSPPLILLNFGQCGSFLTLAWQAPSEAEAQCAELVKAGKVGHLSFIPTDIKLTGPFIRSTLQDRKIWTH